MTFEKQKQPKKKGIAHTNDATLAQGNQMLNLILQKKTPVKNLQQLFASGLQSMLLEACNECNLATINPFAFRKFFGLDPIEVIPYGMTHKLDIHSITSMEGFIEEHLKMYKFDRKPFIHKDLEHTISFLGRKNVRLYAVDVKEVKYADSKLEKADIESASLDELIKFAFLNPMLEGWLSATVVALRSRWHEQPDKYEYPFIRYEHGEIKECGRMRSDMIISNGFPDVNHRFFFLGK